MPADAPKSAVASSTPEPITKLIVAVHGIGDQFKYATIQSVALQIANFCETPMPFPLGQFHPKEGEVRALQFDAPEKYQQFFKGLGFAEVFWADLHQEAQKTGNTIEESKAWAHTMVQRMHAYDVSPDVSRGAQLSPSVDYAKTSAVVEEMIETIGVLENLSFIAAKAGLLKFELRALLDDYLGAVQLVAEFGDYGGRIFGRFADLMCKLLKAHPGVTDIYIVAHSEGTVVSFHGLLSALAAPGGPDQDWVKLVRGYMTIGSPIDKHIVFWPALWNEFHQKMGQNGNLMPWTAAGVRREKPIAWWNYYDRGDPVGFQLDTARDWLMDNGWVEEDPQKKKADGTRVPAGPEAQRFFDFPKENDVGFTRYYLPGAAHNDYWKDSGVFGHFISAVMTKDGPKKQPVPRSGFWAPIVSWILPYLLCYLLLCGGTYVLYKNLHPFLKAVSTETAISKPTTPAVESAGGSTPAQPAGDKGDEETFKVVVKTVAGIAALLAGLTVMSRIPRLVRIGVWHLVAVGVFAAGALAYATAVAPSVQRHLGDCFFGSPPSVPGSIFNSENEPVIIVAAGIALLAAVLSKFLPHLGMKPLMILAALATLRIAYVFAHHPHGTPQPLWPLALSAAGFLYLWWLAALIFDLVFVWHRYICSNESTRILKKVRNKRRQAAGEVAAAA